ncbi:unnamed protein product [Cyprideis torosa]|uniref:Uncharacterized protein n=1 Tax=Cyprideis torosa TaxID=163714 RepID=A0A7R8W766_9CRUS|nr:unnamed protein product [Cyprideis torosa]CAG0887232.1 unnamed protein product [Cyprideis torosa]
MFCVFIISSGPVAVVMVPDGQNIEEICKIVEERKACEKIVQFRNGTYCEKAIAKEIYKKSDACKEERLPHPVNQEAPATD